KIGCHNIRSDIDLQLGVFVHADVLSHPQRQHRISHGLHLPMVLGSLLSLGCLRFLCIFYLADAWAVSDPFNTGHVPP
ncbi:hypothetical protein R0J89_18105, partial [Psychrobacter sp. SIMBA_152]